MREAVEQEYPNHNTQITDRKISRLSYKGKYKSQTVKQKIGPTGKQTRQQTKLRIFIPLMNSLTQFQLKTLRQLLQKKFRDEEQKFLVEGFRSVEEALQSGWEIAMVIGTEKSLSDESARKIHALVKRKKIPSFELSKKDIETLSDTVHTQEIIAVVRQKKFELSAFPGYAAPRSTFVAFDSVNEPGNLGTMLRTCDWFGVEGVLLGKNCVELFNPKVVRASMGAIFHLPIVEEVDLEKELMQLKTQNFVVASTSSHATKSLFDISVPKKSVIIFGNEAHGISSSLEKLSALQFSIPKFGNTNDSSRRAESLNVASACASVLTVWRMSGK